jgi:AcrR family transcriptional regulator
VTDDTKVDGRRERSRATRARVVSAATARFTERGYLATTIESVAAEAGVAVQSVYYLFGTKRNLLQAVLDARIAGDGGEVPVLERPWVEALRAERDAGAAVEGLVAASVPIVARTASVYEVIRRASADPDVAELLDETRRRRRSDQRALVEILDRAGHLRADVDVDTAADVLYGVMNEEVFQCFTRDCGWSVDRFRAWAGELLLDQLVGRRS